MALPNSLQQNRMTNATTGDQVDDGVSALETALCDLLGIPINTNILAALFQADAAGLKKAIFQNLAADPTLAGEFVRNGLQLKYHDGNAVRTIITSAQDKVIVKNVDQSSASGTPVADSALFFPALTGETWVVEATIFYAADTTNHFGAYLVPSTATGVWALGAVGGSTVSPPVGTIAFPNVVADGVFNPNQVIALGGYTPSGGNVAVGLLRGTYFVNADCNIQFSFGTGNGSAASVTVYHGSHMIARRV